MTGIELILKERNEQLTKHHFTPEHDDRHQYQELAMMAAGIAAHGTDLIFTNDELEGNAWEVLRKHPGDRITQLAVAGALCAAEIDRLQRLKEKGEARP